MPGKRLFLILAALEPKTAMPVVSFPCTANVHCTDSLHFPLVKFCYAAEDQFIISLARIFLPDYSNPPIMLYNYLKISFRNLMRNKGFTFINVAGLAAGLASCLLIVFYVVDELSYDRYNLKAERIYRTDIEVKFGNNANSYAAVPGPLGIEGQANFPEIEHMVRLRPAYEQPAGFQVKKAKEGIAFEEKSAIYADPSLFDVFTFPMLSGNPQTALVSPYSIVITESTAKKYFNSAEVVGQMLVFDDTLNYKITGIIKDFPAQSHFAFDFFISMNSLPADLVGGWAGGGYNTYMLLKPGSNANLLDKKLSELTMQRNSAWMTKGNYLKISLRPLTTIHLRSNLQQELGRNGNIQYVYIFSAIAIFILLIACVNFMNLSTARSANRAREVGVRKVLGSPRKLIIAQFLSESLLITFVSTLLAIVVAGLLLPFFNNVSGKQLEIGPRTLIWLAPAALAVVIIVGCIAGSYPAVFLSAFQPVDVLKGKIAKGFRGGGLRSFLVVFQFSISIFLIIGTIAIYNQLHFIQTKDLGYDREQVLIIKNTEGLGARPKTLKDQVKQLAGVVNASMSLYVPTGGNSYITALFPSSAVLTNESMLTEFWPVDEGYVKTLGLQLISGRDFSADLKTDSSAIIVNEAAAKFFGFKDAVNKTVYQNTDGVKSFHIIGVIKDFHFKSLRENITPVALHLSEDRGALSVKMHTADITGLMGEINKKWRAVAPNQQLEYSFMDADFDAAYRTETRIGTIFVIFTVLAICIACLGLFGLSAYAAEQRTKEIGIRKVLGANVSTLVAMLSKDFVRLVCIAIGIASPLAWFAMDKWLEGFAYRTSLHWWMVGIAGIISVLIAFLTIGFQSVKAALANPVESLRSE
jgi:putative ABC transport system permease protein